jgi:REP element-mobilizing transposase RayT
MPNHVHLIFTPFLNEQSLTEIKFSNPRRFESSEPTLGAVMQSLKGYTAHEANKLLNRTGRFWEVESYDHEVKDAEEFDRITKYVLNNPVKAGLVKNWEDWRWNFLAKM